MAKDKKVYRKNYDIIQSLMFAGFFFFFFGKLTPVGAMGGAHKKNSTQKRQNKKNDHDDYDYYDYNSKIHYDLGLVWQKLNI